MEYCFKHLSYRLNDFYDNKTNICFIMGLSGSGKSTFAKLLAKSLTNEKNNYYLKKEYDNVVYVALDDLLLTKCRFTLEKLKNNYNDLVYSYFNGCGNKYFIDREEFNNLNIKDRNEYEKLLFPDFIKYTIEYSKIHNNKRFIIEGVELFESNWASCIDADTNFWVDPKIYLNYSYIILTAHPILTFLRAVGRNFECGKNIIDKISAMFKYTLNIKEIKWWYRCYKQLKKTVDYLHN